MTIQDSLILPSHPLFQGASYNRRPLTRSEKPTISKLIGVSTWVCRIKGVGPIAYGPNMVTAYLRWKVLVQRC
jgi:hypothetical protein